MSAQSLAVISHFTQSKTKNFYSPNRVPQDLPPAFTIATSLLGSAHYSCKKNHLTTDFKQHLIRSHELNSQLYSVHWQLVGSPGLPGQDWPQAETSALLHVVFHSL